MQLTLKYQFFYFLYFHSTLVFFAFLSEYKSNSRKIILSLKISKYQPGTKRWYFLNKKKFSSFLFCNLFHHLQVYPRILSTCVYVWPKQGTHASLITGCNFNGLEFLEFQNKSKYSSNIFHYQIYASSKMEIKNYDSFFKSALLLSGDIQLNSVPTSDTSFVCKEH